MEQIISVSELLAAETEFLELALPSHRHPSEDVIGSCCCSENCVLHIKRIDILRARFEYLKFHRNLGVESKKDARKIFLSSLKRISNDKIVMVSLNNEWPTCPALFARTFGMSLNILMNSFGDSTLSSFRQREWYQKTIDLLAEGLKKVSEHVQFNSLNQIMVSPSLGTQLPSSGSRTISMAEIRRKMDIKIRQRKNDSLVRCSACFGLKELLQKSSTDAQQTETKKMLAEHYRYISQQRALVQTMCAQSRDDQFDLNVILVDGMSNRHTKLPRLCDRPKFVTDALRVTLNLTTVQIAQNDGVNSFCNFDYPSIQTVFSHDSSYILSLFLDGLTKLESMPSVLMLILDSAPNNKSFVMLGGLGVILRKLSVLQKIYVLYPSTGHTHQTVDGHFGTLSRSLASTNLMDPIEFSEHLNSLGSVTKVVTSPTVYDFAGIQQYINKVGNLFSNSQICVSKDKSGVIYWSSASSMHSSLLFSSDTNQNAFELFQPNFDVMGFSATIRKPEIAQSTTKIKELIKQCGELFSAQNRENFDSFIQNYGKKAFRQTILDLNHKDRKLTVSSNGAVSAEDPHITVLQHLQNNGFPTGKIPKTPIVR